MSPFPSSSIEKEQDLMLLVDVTISLFGNKQEPKKDPKLHHHLSKRISLPNDTMGHVRRVVTSTTTRSKAVAATANKTATSTSNASFSIKGKTFTTNPIQPRVPFLEQLKRLLDDETYSNVITWMPDGQAFTVVNRKQFADHIMPEILQIRIMSSFLRKLNQLGFVRLHCKETMNLDIFHRPGFVRDAPEQEQQQLRCTGADIVDNDVGTIVDHKIQEPSPPSIIPLTPRSQSDIGKCRYPTNEILLDLQGQIHQDHPRPCDHPQDNQKTVINDDGDDAESSSSDTDDTSFVSTAIRNYYLLMMSEELRLRQQYNPSYGQQQQYCHLPHHHHSHPPSTESSIPILESRNYNITRSSSSSSLLLTAALHQFLLLQQSQPSTIHPDERMGHQKGHDDEYIPSRVRSASNRT